MSLATLAMNLFLIPFLYSRTSVQYTYTCIIPLSNLPTVMSHHTTSHNITHQAKSPRPFICQRKTHRFLSPGDNRPTPHIQIPSAAQKNTQAPDRPNQSKMQRHRPTLTFLSPTLLARPPSPKPLSPHSRPISACRPPAAVSSAPVDTARHIAR